MLVRNASPAASRSDLGARSRSRMARELDQDELIERWTLIGDDLERVASKRSAAESMQALGISKVDTSELEAICKEIVAANPKIVADVKGGKQQAVGALVGQAKKKNPNANPNDVRRICLELIEKM